MEQTQTVQFKQPLTVTLTKCDQALQSRLEKNTLWGAATQESQNGGIPVKFVPANCLFGWDSVRVCKTADINQRIRSANSAPTSFCVQIGDEGAELTAEGRLGCWQIAPGGAGRNLNLSLPIEECTLQEPDRESLHLQGLTVIAQINLSALPIAGMESGQEPLSPAVSILSISGGEDRRLRDTAWLKLALADWCQDHLDTLLSFFPDADTIPAGQRRYACMEAFDPGNNMIGVLSSEDPARLPKLQHILPVEAADAVLISQDSAAGQNLLRSLPVFKRFPANDLKSTGDGFRVSASFAAPSAGENDLPLTVNTFFIRTQPHLQAEMDVSVCLPSGITVHLTIHSAFEAVFSKGNVRFHAGTSSILSHYAEIPGGGNLTEDIQQEIAQAVEQLASRALY